MGAHGEFQGFRQESEGYVSDFAPHETLKFITREKLTFDERVGGQEGDELGEVVAVHGGHLTYIYIYICINMYIHTYIYNYIYI